MIQSVKYVCQSIIRHQSRCSSTSTLSAKAEWKKRKNTLFDNEKQRQINAVGRIEKVTVKFFSPTDEIHFRMNKNLSTPYDIAKHVSEFNVKSGALALVDNSPWDMHKPFVNDCVVKILTMDMPKESFAVNATFWRSCSLILGAVVDSAFKDDINVYLHSFPWPNIRSGSFVYDVILDLPNWTPTNSERRALSAAFVKITNEEIPFERLEVTEDLALDMFQENPFKSKQIPEIAKVNDNKVTLYRLKDHIDISKGPVIGNTNIIGKCSITAVHKIHSDETDNFYRFQGVAIPRNVRLNHFAFSILEDRSKKINETMWIPQTESEESETKIAVSASS